MEMRPRATEVGVLTILFGCACGGPGAAPVTAAPGVTAPSGALARVGDGHAAPPSSTASSPHVAHSAAPAGAPAKAPAGKLRLRDARLRMLALLNRDRATQGLAPLTLDEGPAQTSGQRHAEDMAKNGFLGHWGTDGSVPEQRHTEAGGADMVLENASCVDDLKQRTLDPDPLIDEADIVRAEHMFFDEVPPNDGHRKNILRPHHLRVGIGIAQPLSTATEIAVPCFTQEMVDPYGTYVAVTKTAKVGAIVHVEGTIRGPATFGGVGISRVDAPRPLTPAEANKRRSYPVPAPHETYWPKGFVTKIPVEVTGATFKVDVPLSDAGKPGLYGIGIFGKLPGQASHGLLGLRTVLVTH